MKVDDDHLYHGAALIQIAEHPQFTTINSFKLTTGVSRSAYKINDEIGVYLKYASKPTPAFKEYVFTFRREHLNELKEIALKVEKVFMALVCVAAREICCLPYKPLTDLVAKRRAAKGAAESQYNVLVTLPARKSFRVYINKPGAKKTMLGKPRIINRNDFPDKLFE